MNQPLAHLQSVPNALDAPERVLRRRSQAQAPRFGLALQAIVTLAPGRHPAWVECLLRGADGRSTMDTVRAGYGARGHRFDLDVLDAALAQAAVLHSSTRIGVNIHPQSLEHAGFVEAVLDSIRGRHLEPRRLVLELVEFDGAIDLLQTRAALERLRAAGVRIALDDFGPGAPNFDVVAAGLVDWIKLDRSLCRQVDTDPGVRRVLAGLAALVRHTGPGLVAEGIERAGQMHALRALGIVHQQGFLFHRPAHVSPLPEPGSTH